MRIGGPVFAKWQGPDEWAQAHLRARYTAAYCPVDETADDRTVHAFAEAAAKARLVIAEVGAWSNPISLDAGTARKAIELSIARLDLAERIGARCCVNIAGSRHPAKWDGPHPDNYSAATFDLIVETVRGIIDAVKPTRSFYTLECMEWTPPYSADGYLDLLKAIDRQAFAVHFDPVNMIWSPMRYYQTGEIIREFVAKLGPHIRSVHAKDIHLTDQLTVHLGEVVPGKGNLDYPTLLRELAKLDPDTPVMLEHLANEADYKQAAEHIRGVAKEVGVTL